MQREFKWRLVNCLSRALEPDEQNAVLGDFAESGVNGWKALRDLLGLVIRRQAGLWKDWRPFLALLGLVGPLGMLVYSSGLGGQLGQSLWTRWHFQTRYGSGLTAMQDLIVVISQSAALILWSWSSGFALASLSRRTVWMLRIVLYLAWCGWLAVLLRSAVPVSVHREILRLAFRMGPCFLLGIFLCLVPFNTGMRKKGTLGMRRAIVLASAVAIATLLAAWTNGWQQTALANWSEGQLHSPPVWPKQLLPLALAIWPTVYLVGLARSRRAVKLRTL
jgi:hypothetical protein